MESEMTNTDVLSAITCIALKVPGMCGCVSKWVCESLSKSVPRIIIYEHAWAPQLRRFRNHAIYVWGGGHIELQQTCHVWISAGVGKGIKFSMHVPCLPGTTGISSKYFLCEIRWQWQVYRSVMKCPKAKHSQVNYIELSQRISRLELAAIFPGDSVDEA